jgi:hypothetical protein
MYLIDYFCCLNGIVCMFEKVITHNNNNVLEDFLKYTLNLNY